MSDNTLIEWADATVNAVNGCSVLSPGCTHCYAMKLAGTRLKNHPSREGLTQPSKAGPVWTGEVRLNEDQLLQPLRWKRPRRIFWNAHGDLFHENVPEEWIDRVFAVCALTPQHTHMILTKRPERMREYVSGGTCDGARRFHIADAAGRMMEDGDNAHDYVAAGVTWPLPNVWLGTSAEDQTRADERKRPLAHWREGTPAAVRFLSCEPLLGPIIICEHCARGHHPIMDSRRDPRSKYHAGVGGFGDVCGFNGLSWVIVGGESGPGARPMHPDWARSLRDQCAAASVPFFFKQWGSWLPDKPFQRLERRGVMMDANGRRPTLADMPAIVADTFDFAEFHHFADVGKKAAGRLLDGREHSEFPA